MSKARLEAILWDMDGVIADTADYHYNAWREVFKERGVEFSKADFMRYFGRRHDTIVHFALGKIPPEEVARISEKKQALYRRNVKENIVPLPGAVELIKLLHKNGIKSAIASSAVPSNIDIIIDGLGITKYFQAIADGSEVFEGKPSPQVFQLAAQKLGVQPSNCVVIEDAIAGVAAAKSAGMKCLAVTNSHPADKLEKADLIVNSLEQIDISVLSGLFSKE
jgi:beta-phosphoglucomutase